VADQLLVNYTSEIYGAMKKMGWDGKEEKLDPQWSFPGAMLYSITVITTIGLYIVCATISYVLLLNNAL